MKIFPAVFIAAFAVAAPCSFGQILISSLNTAYTENFNSIGTTATASLPANWKISPAGTSSPTWAAAGNFTATTQAASSGSPTAGGRYNWGNGTTTSDRAIGVMTSGSYASPNSIMSYFQNTTGTTIDSLTISFDIERYRTNTAAASVTFYTSFDGINWTAQAAGNTGAFSTGTSAYNFTSGTVVSKSVTLTSLSLANSGNLYLRWDFNTTGSNSQGLGLDNVSLTASAIPEPSTYAAIFGAVALTGGILRRRRQRKAASAAGILS